MALHIAPLTLDRWEDFATLFGPNGACAGCWCMWFRLRRRAFEAGHGEANRAAFHARVAAGPPPGVLAFDDGKPVGWLAAAPRSELPVLDRSPNLKPVDDAPVWSLTCFFIHRAHRRAGLSRLLIDAACDLARAEGGGIAEAYPWDLAARRPSGSATLYVGTLETFRRAGFEVVARRAAHRPIVRRSL